VLILDIKKMKTQKQLSTHRFRNILFVLMPGNILLFLQNIWKMSYMGGVIPGICWLFVFLDWVFIPSIITTVIVGIILLFSWEASHKKKLILRITSFSMFFRNCSARAGKWSQA